MWWNRPSPWCSNSAKSCSCLIRRLSGAFTINRTTNERIYPTNKNNAIAGDFFGSLQITVILMYDAFVYHQHKIAAAGRLLVEVAKMAGK